jgi:hypothetical protein
MMASGCKTEFGGEGQRRRRFVEQSANEHTNSILLFFCPLWCSFLIDLC